MFPLLSSASTKIPKLFTIDDDNEMLYPSREWLKASYENLRNGAPTKADVEAAQLAAEAARKAKPRDPYRAAEAEKKARLITLRYKIR